MKAFYNFFIAAFLLLPVTSNADCIACSHLKGVTIKLKNGNMKEGYVRWNPTWAYYNNDGPVDSFPFSIVSFSKRMNSKIFIFKKINFLNELFPGVPFVLKSDIDSTNAEDITEILVTPGEYDNIASLALQEVSTKKYTILKQKPFAIFCGSLEVPADVCIVSYNKEYPEKKLQEICKGQYWLMSKDLENNNVFVFEFAND